MHFARGVHHAGLRAGLVGGQARFARHRETHQVGHGAAAAQAAAEALAAERAREAAHELPLDGHRRRRRAPGRDVLIEDARQQIRERGHRLTRAEHVSVEAWCRRARQGEHLAQGIERASPQTLLGQRRLECPRHLLAAHGWESPQLVESGEQVGGEVRHARGQGAEFGVRQMQGVHEADPLAYAACGDTTRVSGL